MRFGTFFGIACMGIAMVASLPAKADLIGDTIDPIFYNGMITNMPITRISDGYIFAPEDENYYTSQTGLITSSGLTYTNAPISDTALLVTGTQIKLTNDNNQPYCSTTDVPCGDSFFGYEFVFSKGTAATVSSVTYDAGSASDYVPKALPTWTGDDLFLNLAGLDPATYDTLTLDFAFASNNNGGGNNGGSNNGGDPTPTPEPMSAALLGAGVVGLLALRSRRSMPLGHHA